MCPIQSRGPCLPTLERRAAPRHTTKFRRLKLHFYKHDNKSRSAQHHISCQCRMGNVVPFSVVDGPEAWTAADYPYPSQYIYHFTESDLTELEAAVQRALQQGKDIKVVLALIFVHACRPNLWSFSQHQTRLHQLRSCREWHSDRVLKMGFCCTSTGAHQGGLPSAHTGTQTCSIPGRGQDWARLPTFQVCTDCAFINIIHICLAPVKKLKAAPLPCLYLLQSLYLVRVACVKYLHQSQGSGESSARFRDPEHSGWSQRLKLVLAQGAAGVEVHA